VEIVLEQLIKNLTNSGLMSADEVVSFRETIASGHREADLDTAVQDLIDAGKLTRYQADCLCRGETAGLAFGDYIVLDKIGQGGMGVVLKAQHRRMNRLVAVKKLPSAALESEDAVKRFYREVEAAARLLHPNIVAAFDASEYDGVHYLIMEYIAGQDLATILKERGPLPVEDAVGYVIQAAQGLTFAHKQGIIHRDIKPANLLLDAEGVVKILDMGLARIASEAETGDAPDQLTGSGQVMGTCDYMAPEQAEDTHAVDHRADIYSLGCTLYRLLIGQPLYSGTTLLKVLLAHREAEIPSLLDKQPGIPESVDAVFQKMVAKQPGDRYSSMAEVIEALRAAVGRSSAPIDVPEPDSGLMDFLQQIRRESPNVAPGGRSSDRTVSARATATEKQQTTSQTEETMDLVSEGDTDPTTMNQQLSATTAAPRSRRSAARRRQTRMLLLMGVGIGLSLVGAAVIGVILYVQTSVGTVVVRGPGGGALPEDVKVILRQDGETIEVASTGTSMLTVHSGEYEIAISGGEDRFQLEEDYLTVRRSSRTVVTLKHKDAAEDGTPGDGLPGGPSPFLKLNRDDIDPYELAVAGGGDAAHAPPELVAIYGDSRLNEGQPIVQMAVSPDDKTIASVGQNSGAITLWDADTGHLVRRLVGHDGRVRSARFHPDGKRLFSSGEDGTVKIWNLSTGETLKSVLIFDDGKTRGVNGLHVSPAGDKFLTFAPDGMFFWDAENGKRLGGPRIEADDIAGASFSPNGKMLATRHKDSMVRVWRMSDGTEIHALKHDNGRVHCVAFRPDGRELATGGDHESVQLWDLATGESRASFNTHSDPHQLVYSSCGRTLAVRPSYAAVVQLFELPSGRQKLQLAGHAGWTSGVAFSRDGKTLITASHDGSIRRWSTEGAALTKRLGHCGALTDCDVTPSGSRLITSSLDRTVKIWNVAGGKVAHTIDVRDAPCIPCSVAVGPKGRRLAVMISNSEVRMFSLATRRQLWQSTRRAGGEMIRYSADGSLLAAGGKSHLVLLDAATGLERRRIDYHGQEISMALTSDGKTLAASHFRDSEIHLFDVETGKETATLDNRGWLKDLTTGPNANLLAAVRVGCTAKLFDLTAKSVARELPPMCSMAFSPDGRYLAGASDKTLRIMAIDTSGESTAVLFGRRLGRVKFAPDGRHILIANSDSTVYVVRPALR